jgi:BON domain
MKLGLERHEEGLAPDYEGWSPGHYRGRGNRQDGTGPSGPWLDGRAGQRMTLPHARHETVVNRPKNYRRSDVAILEEVFEVLSDHGDLDVSDIEVFMDDGDVILRGTVRSRWAKFYAEDLAAGVRGVRDVVSELRILRRDDGRELGGPTDDGGASPPRAGRF